MRRLLAVLFAAVLIMTGLMASGFAQEKKAPATKAAAAKEDRWHGSIIRFDTARKTLELRRAGQTISRTVVYTDSTKWTDNNKPAQMPAFKEGMDFIAVGTFDKDGRLIARQIDLRKR